MNPESLISTESRPSPPPIITGSDGEDEGYASFRLSPADFAGFVDWGYSDEEGEVEFVKKLANLHQVLETPAPEELIDAKFHIEDSIQAAENLKAQEEQAGAERSRILRERALCRQRSVAKISEQLDERAITCGSSEELNFQLLKQDPSLTIAQQQNQEDSKHHEITAEGALVHEESDEASPTPSDEDRHLEFQQRNIQQVETGVQRREIRRERSVLLQRSEAVPVQPSLDENCMIPPQLPSLNQSDRDPDSKTSAYQDATQHVSKKLSGLEMLALKNGHNDFWAVSDDRGAAKAPMSSQNQIENGSHRDMVEIEVERMSPPKSSSFDIQSQRSQDSRQSRSQGQRRDINEEPSVQPKPTPVAIPAKTHLTLPKRFDSLPEESKSIIVQHETAKERKRDLETIDRAAASIARLRCSGFFTPQDEKELFEVYRFMKLVLRENKYGKLARKRIQDIRFNFESRAKYYDMPTQEETKLWYDSLFDANDIATLKENLSQVEEQISELGGKRSALHSHRKSNTPSKRKTVTFSLAPEDQSPVSHRPPTTHREKRKAAKNRQTSQNASQDKQLELLRQKLSEFNHSYSREQGQSLKKDDSPASENDSDESTISEDVSGLEYYQHVAPRLSDSFKDNHDTDIGNTQQRQVESVRSRGTQQFDPQLLNEMREKQKLLDSQAESVAGLAEAGESDADVVSSSDESDYEDEEGDDTPKQLYKYTVWGTFCGVENYVDNDKYRFHTTYKLGTANQKISECVVEFQSFFTKSGIGADRWSLEIEFDNGLMEQRVHLGPDSEVEARFFLTKELVDLGRRAYRRARAQIVAVRDAVYTVEWEHTLTPLRNQHEAEGQGMEGDLFGDETSGSPPASFEPITTTIPSSQVVHYNDAASANRGAVRIYLDWHFRFLPGLENEHWRRLEHEHAEDQLKGLGDWGLWSREETMEGEIEEEDDGGDDYDGHDAAEDVDNNKDQQEEPVHES